MIFKFLISDHFFFFFFSTYDYTDLHKTGVRHLFFFYFLSSILNYLLFFLKGVWRAQPSTMSSLNLIKKKLLFNFCSYSFFKWTHSCEDIQGVAKVRSRHNWGEKKKNVGKKNIDFFFSISQIGDLTYAALGIIIELNFELYFSVINISLRTPFLPMGSHLYE